MSRDDKIKQLAGKLNEVLCAEVDAYSSDGTELAAAALVVELAFVIQGGWSQECRASVTEHYFEEVQRKVSAPGTILH